MSKSLVLSVLVIILLASSVMARTFQQKGPLRGCMSLIGIADPGYNCDAECKGLHSNPAEEAQGITTNMGTSPPFCFCSYKCGGTISEKCRVQTGALIKDGPNVDEDCENLCTGYSDGRGLVTKFEFGDICQCDFDC